MAEGRRMTRFSNGIEVESWIMRAYAPPVEKVKILKKTRRERRAIKHARRERRAEKRELATS